ncbi:30S ribosomal protein S15 [archaeon]|jgi:small subunit ribosomal protein S15|nr:30S ribosomal protein S15 [archaeon]MBT4022411.1 30S ribosomal protein S15 [archaeon]MBT4273289.1 30S ribosomal protein S15 [archaeon]MBT4461268.1 30S ribosomal protein S15 [archaeon]MBT4858565.1 30S ribosomal protein S15 [archaeon]
MARMHSRKKGKSGSTKPLKKEKYTWMNYKPKEVELLIVKIAKEGNDTSKIGMVLRDTYGIPDVKSITKSSISDILEKRKLLPTLPENLTALLKRIVALQKHLEQNKHDVVAKRGLQLTESKVRRLIKYYKNSGKLALDWNYNPKRVSLLIE